MLAIKQRTLRFAPSSSIKRSGGPRPHSSRNTHSQGHVNVIVIDISRARELLWYQLLTSLQRPRSFDGFYICKIVRINSAEIIDGKRKNNYELYISFYQAYNIISISVLLYMILYKLYIDKTRINFFNFFFTLIKLETNNENWKKLIIQFNI